MIHHQNNSQTYILIYVDDILLTGNNQTQLTNLITTLHTHFQLKNLGKISTFLGIETIHTPNNLFHHQSSYTHELLNRAGMTQCKPVPNPSPLKTPLTTDSLQPYPQPHQYRHLVSSLQYLTNTRPDITLSVNKLCQHLHNPLNIHFIHLKRLLRYLQATPNIGLTIHSDSLNLHTYADSDWAGDPTDRKSTTGYCSFLGQTPINWCVKKQSTVARSSTEAEYRALATAAQDIIWLRRLLKEFQIPLNQPTPLHCDSSSAIALVHNPVFHARTKHIEIDHHFIRDCVHHKHITVQHISTKDQHADIFTRFLPTPQFVHLRNKLMPEDRSSPCRGVIKDKAENLPETALQSSQSLICNGPIPTVPL